MIVDCTRGLLALEDENRTMRIHKSFQDYCDGKPEQMRKLFLEADAELAAVCLDYMSLPIFGSGHCMKEDEWLRRQESNPFLGYAAVRWGEHVKTAGEEMFLNENPRYPLICFLLDSTRMAVAAQAMIRHTGPVLVDIVRPTDVARSKSPPSRKPTFSALPLAVVFGLLRVADQLRERGFNVDTRSFLDITPLHYAVRLGNAEAVKYLLEYAVNADYVGVHRQSTLSTAATWNRPYLIPILLDSRPGLLDHKNWAGLTPLIEAIVSGHTMCAEILSD